MLEGYYISFGIAFDKDENLEFMIYRDLIHDNNVFYSEPVFKKYILPIGSFLLMFLNTNFEDESECASFIYNFCFESLYYQKYPKKKEDLTISFIRLSLPHKEFVAELKKIVSEEQSFLIYIKNVFLQNLNLPYNEEIIKSTEKEAEEDEKNIKPEIIELAKKLEKDSLEYYSKKDEERKRALNFVKKNFNDLYVKAKEKHNKRIEKNNQNHEKTIETYDHTDINSLISNLSLDFDMISFLFAGINTSHYNIPYGFKSKDVYSILALDFKEFKTTKYNIIRKCQNCWRYFIPSNLKETKYCNEIYDEEARKTCRQIGKELAYKKSLKEDKSLDMYRRRYMSLASAVSHYGTDKAIERFEKYKTEGAIMKAKYQNKEITAEEFENWINNTKK